MKSTDKNIQYGNIDLLAPDEFAAHNVKLRVTTMIDLDVLNAIKAEAAKRHKPYQTLLNETLRKVFIQSQAMRAELTEDEIIQVKKLLSNKIDGIRSSKRMKATG